MENQELYHHGIKGMRWGVRRTQAQLARVRGSKSGTSSKGKSDDTKVDGATKGHSDAKAKAKKIALKGAKASAKAVNKIGKAYLTDQLFFGGAGTRAAKTTIKYTGRAAVTAYTMARGGYDIRWYDN